MGKKIKQQSGNNNSRIIKEPTYTQPPLSSGHPIFCLKYIVKGYSLKQCDKNEHAALSKTLYKLSQFSWPEAQLKDKHGVGSEKISRDALSKSISHGAPEDATFLAFRFSGMKSMIGYKDHLGVFRILALDRNFTAYDHG